MKVNGNGLHHLPFLCLSENSTFFRSNFLGGLNDKAACSKGHLLLPVIEV